MNNFICITCGTQFSQTGQPPESCPICSDERQYIGEGGQQWTTLPDLQETHKNKIDRCEKHLYGISTEPKFAIGQRALLIQSEQGNILWDCISLIDEQTIQQIEALGGVAAIAVSHPHYYGSVVSWAKAFDAPVYLHKADCRWMMRPDSCINFWEGNKLVIQPDITLIRAGGHFEGGTVCHWASGGDNQGILLTGDVIQVVSDNRWVSFMYSYPNYIPLPAWKVEKIAEAVKPYPFVRIYGAWWKSIVASDANAAVQRSAKRYVDAIYS